MFDSFIKDIDSELSQDIKRRAEGYLKIKIFGSLYYFPVTKEMKKIFKLKRVKNKLYFTNDDPTKQCAEKFLRDMARAIYLQMREDIQDNVTESLSEQLKDSLDNFFRKSLTKKVKDEVRLKLPGGNKSEQCNIPKL